MSHRPRRASGAVGEGSGAIEAGERCGGGEGAGPPKKASGVVG